MMRLRGQEKAPLSQGPVRLRARARFPKGLPSCSDSAHHICIGCLACISLSLTLSLLPPLFFFILLIVTLPSLPSLPSLRIRPFSCSPSPLVNLTSRTWIRTSLSTVLARSTCVSSHDLLTRHHLLLSPLDSNSTCIPRFSRVWPRLWPRTMRHRLKMSSVSSGPALTCLLPANPPLLGPRSTGASHPWPSPPWQREDSWYVCPWLAGEQRSRSITCAVAVVTLCPTTLSQTPM